MVVGDALSFRWFWRDSNTKFGKWLAFGTHSGERVEELHKKQQTGANPYFEEEVCDWRGLPVEPTEGVFGVARSGDSGSSGFGGPRQSQSQRHLPFLHVPQLKIGNSSSVSLSTSPSKTKYSSTASSANRLYST